VPGGTPIPANPGTHLVIARVGAREQKRTFDLAEGETKEITFDFTSAIVREKREKTDATEASRTSGTPSNVPVLVAFGVAGAGLVVGTVTGLVAMSNASSAREGCVGNRCPPATWSAIDTSNSMATISTVGFVVAGVGAATGAAILVLRKGKPKASTSEAALDVRPWMGAGSAGLVGSF
ncbi:MAG: hypothetical protein U0169_25970, partial [Polyangiaceae bacterium]